MFDDMTAETIRQVAARDRQIESLQAEVEALRKDAVALWMMLDDIDTGGDIAKGDDVLYRAIAERSHKRRFDSRFKWVIAAIDAAMEKSQQSAGNIQQ